MAKGGAAVSVATEPSDRASKSFGNWEPDDDARGEAFSASLKDCMEELDESAGAATSIVLGGLGDNCT